MEMFRIQVQVSVVHSLFFVIFFLKFHAYVLLFEHFCPLIFPNIAINFDDWLFPSNWSIHQLLYILSHVLSGVGVLDGDPKLVGPGSSWPDAVIGDFAQQHMNSEESVYQSCFKY